MRQYNWKEFGEKNFGYIIAGAIIAAIKFILYEILMIRMYIAGVFIFIAPIIIMINSFQKISGEENPTILKSWLKWFIFLTILRPLLGIVYYVIFGLNPYSFAKDPIYIILLFVFFILAIILLIFLAFKINVKNIGKKKIA